MSLDLNAVVEEDDISKVILAQEIERTRALFHQCDGELQTQIDGFSDRVKSAITQLEEANRIMIESQKKDILDLISNAKKDIDKIHADTLIQIRQEIKNYTAAVEKKISGLTDVAKRTASEEIGRYIDEIYKKSDQTYKDVEFYKKDTDKLLGNYQVETRDKINSIVSDFKKIKDKFSDISRLLS